MDLFNLKKYDWRILLHPKKLFLENLGLKQTIIKNTFWLGFAEVVSKILKFFLFIYIARVLGATEYGKFSFALSFVSLFIIFSDLSLVKIIIREFAREKEQEKDFSGLLSLKIFLNFAAYLFIFVGSFLITNDSFIRTLIYILGAEVLINNSLLFFFAFFRARQKMEFQAVFGILQAFLVSGFGIAVLLLIPSVKNLAWVYLLSTVVCLVLILLFFNFRLIPLRFSFDFSVWKKYLKLSFPLALGAFFGAVYSNIDSAILGHLGKITENGWYNAAKRIAGAAVIPATFVTMSFFPVLSRFFKKDKKNLQKAWDYYISTMIFWAAPMVVGGVALSRRIIELVYGAGYFQSVSVFEILIVAFAFSLFFGPLGNILIVANQQKKVFWILFLTGLLNALLNLILISKYSYFGAALSCFFSYLFSLIISFWVTSKFSGIKPLNKQVAENFLISVISSSIMYLVLRISFISRLHLIWVIFISAVTYSLLFLIFKIFLKYVKKNNQPQKI